jgi:hypothetical protein
VLSFIALQLGWFACVLGARWGLPWLGPVVVCLLTLHALRTSSKAYARQTLLLLAMLAGVGFAIDSILLYANLLTRSDGGRLSPLWLVALWPNFGLAALPDRSLWALRHRPIASALLGAFAGPLAYRGGASLSNSIIVIHGQTSLVTIAVVWALITPAILWLSRTLHGSASGTTHE